MRPDMERVIISRPRTGGWGRRKKTKWGGREAMKPRPQGKNQTDLLGPLKKFLRSHLGQNWDDVWSEICAQADNRSVVGHHLRRHFTYMVEFPVLGDDGKLYSEYAHRRFDEVSEYHGGFYVDPRNNKLCEVERISRKKKETPNKIHEVDGVYFFNNDGTWYRVKMEEIPARRWDSRYSLSIHDEFTDTKVGYYNSNASWSHYMLQDRLKAKYGLSPNKLYWYCVHKESANHKEIKKVLKLIGA